MRRPLRVHEVKVTSTDVVSVKAKSVSPLAHFGYYDELLIHTTVADAPAIGETIIVEVGEA